MLNHIRQQILGLYQRKSYAELIKLFSEHTSIKQCDPNTGLCFANGLRHIGQTDSSKKQFETLIKRFPTIPAILNSYANLLIATEKYDLAERQLKQAIRIDQNFCDAYVNLARLQSLRHQFNLAIKSYSSAKSLRPNDINIEIGLAVTYKSQGDLQTAEGIYQGLLASANGQTNLKVLVNYAALMRDKQKYSDAINTLQQALSYYPQSAMVQSMLAANYALNYEMDKASQYYQLAVQSEPENVTVQIEFAHFRWAQGFEKPFGPLIQSLGDPLAQYELFTSCLDLLLNAEQFDLVSEVLELGFEPLKNDPVFNMFAARYARLTDDLDSAESFIKVAEKYSKRPISVSIENERGYIALAQQKNQQALSIYRNLQRREPDNQGWWTLYSTALKLADRAVEYNNLCDYRLVNCSTIYAEKPASFMQSLTDKLEIVHANTNHPIGQSLRNGTQTYEDIFDDASPVIQELKSWIHQQATQFTQNLQSQKKHPFLCKVGKPVEFSGSWSVRLRKGGYHTSHFHPQGWLSGVFYVDVPKAVDSGGQGWLRFGVPEIAQLDLIEDYCIKPANGTLVLFPSFMWHGTRAFEDGDQRMTIAFDMVPSPN